MAVILMCGPSGSGKSTVARRLEESGWTRLCFDVETWRHDVTSLPAPRELLAQIETELLGRLASTVNAGEDVVLDYSFATRGLRDRYRAVVADLGVTAETVYLPVDRDVALERVRGRHDEGPDDYWLDDATVLAHVDGFEPPTFAEHPLRVIDGDVTVRHAGAGDVGALMEFWEGSAENAARPQDSAALVEALVGRDPAAILVAVLQGRIVGSVIAGWDGWRAHLYRLAVAPEARGRGLARRLLGHAEDRLRSLGATRFDAMVLDDNEAGAALWRSAEYAPQGEWSRWVKPA